MMKRIFKVCAAVLLSVLAVCALCLVCTAEEVLTAETDTLTAESRLQATDGAEAIVTNYTLLGRLEEYVRANKTDVLGVAGDAAILVISLTFGLIQRSKSKKLSLSVSKAVSASTGVSTSQNNVVGAMNTMIESYNQLKQSYDQYGLVEAERNRIVGACVALNTATLEILSLVYTHNKNLPQGVKDLVMLKYANCLKDLEDDKKLCAVVEAVRESLQKGAEPLSEEASEEVSA
jgi:hypothetical protein